MTSFSNIVTEPDHLRWVVEQIRRTPQFVFDGETRPGPGVRIEDPPGTTAYNDAVKFYSLNPRTNEVYWLSLATLGVAVAIPMGHPHGEQIGWQPAPLRPGTKSTKRLVPKFALPPPQMDPAQVFDILKPIFFDDDLIKIAQNFKFDALTLSKYYGELLKPPFADTVVQSQLINENRPLDLGSLVKEVFGYRYEKLGKTLQSESFSRAGTYSYLDSKYEWLLYRHNLALLEEEGLMEYWGFECDVTEVLTTMEWVGAPVRDDEVTELDLFFREEMDRIAGELWAEAGRQFELTKPVDKGWFIFDHLKHKPWMFTPKKKEPSLAAEHLQSFTSDPWVAKLMEWDDLAKLHSTYVLNYGKYSHKGRIHANFKQAGTVTGRFACVAADTLIDMPRDLVKQPEGVPITDVRAGDLVYAFDWQRELVLRPVKWVAQTGVKQTVVVTVEDSVGTQRKLRLTPDHLVRLWNGDWRPAGTLLHAAGRPHRDDGPRVMTMVKRTLEDGYVRIYPHAVARSGGLLGGGRNREHRFVMAAVRGKAVSTKADVHHLDGNRANNSVSNLEYMSVEEHRGRRHLHPGWGQRSALHPHPVLYDGPNDFRVVSVESGPVEPVWDMEVEDAHSFIANSICVHNCGEPNLQNVPKPDTESGRRIRGLFWAGSDDECLVVGDYSQIELRVLAYYSGDPTMVQAFQNGEDIHQASANTLGCDRGIAKNINFAIPFGAGYKKVAAMGGGKFNLRTAKKFYNKHKEDFPTVWEFIADTRRNCRINKPHEVRTILGRKRRLPQITWVNAHDERLQALGAKAERQAVNTRIQGSAADLIKMAMIRLHDMLDEDMHIILQVHDELVVTTPRAKADRCLAIMREAMEGPEMQVLKDVPVTANIKVVDRWADAK